MTEFAQPTAAQFMAALLREHEQRGELLEQQEVAMGGLRGQRDAALEENQELRRENERLRGYLIRFLAVASDAQHVATGTPPPPPPPPFSNPVGGIAATDALAAVAAATRAGR